jgi:hypothetical protein
MVLVWPWVHGLDLESPGLGLESRGFGLGLGLTGRGLGLGLDILASTTLLITR